MMDYIVENWGAIAFGVLGTALGGLCKYFYSKMQEYKTMLDAQEDKAVTDLIKKELQPLQDAILALEQSVKTNQDSDEALMDTIRDLHKYELIRICNAFLGYGFMTVEEYDWLIDFYGLYKRLGGNGQGDAYYEKVKDLPIKDRHWKAHQQSQKR